MRSPGRTRLAEAQADLASARIAVADAEQALSGGEAFVGEARAALQAVNAREQASGVEAAQAIKAAIKEGRSPPRSAAIQGGMVRAAAQAELEAREAALRLLDSESTAARRAEAKAFLEVQQAVRAVLAEDAAAAAEEGMRALEILKRAHRRVTGADRAGYIAPFGPLQTSNLVLDFLRACSPPEDQQQQADAAVGQWLEYRGALATDPEASAPNGELPSVRFSMPGAAPGKQVNLGMVTSNLGGAA